MACEAFAYTVLNLRFNPFGELSNREWIQSSIVEVDHLIIHLTRPGVAVQIIGDHGRGKTTHLNMIHHSYKNEPYLKFFPLDPIPKLNKAAIYFVDSIENITVRQRSSIFRKCQSIVFTTHSDLSREIKRAGFRLVNEEVSCRCEKKLSRILNSRVEVARLGDGEVPKIDMKTIRGLMGLYGDNIRAMQDYLYEYFQDLKGVKRVKL